MDITYIPMVRGFVHLAAVIDWRRRRVLAWRLSITMETSFGIEALEEALARYGGPEIFNTDQGSQFTSLAFTGVLTKAKVAISMDNRGSWRDHVFVDIRCPLHVCLDHAKGARKKLGHSPEHPLRWWEKKA